MRYYVACNNNEAFALKIDGSIYNTNESAIDTTILSNIIGISALDNGHFQALKDDNTVFAAVYDTLIWTDIIEISCGVYHVIGLKSNGTVIGAGSNSYDCISGACSWTDIIEVSAGREWTLGLKSDGTVVGVGRYIGGVLDVSGWSDIKQISAGYFHTLGLKNDGTVLATGRSSENQLDVSGWTDIVQIVAGDKHSLGLKSDGTVVSCGENTYGELDVSGWTDIVQINTSSNLTIGLKPDRTAVCVGRYSDVIDEVALWSNIRLPSDDQEAGLSISGTVRELTTAIDRTVRLHNRSTGELIDTTTSINGKFTFSGLEDIEYQVICLDDSEGAEYNDLIIRCYPIDVGN